MDSPTTSDTESGMECRSADACKHEKNDIGNPVIRIPEHIPERSREEETIAEDIRVPDSFKSEDGLRVRRTLETGDAEDEDEQGNAENGDKTRELDGGRAPVEVQMGTGLGDTTVGQEGPKERECRHVPVGTREVDSPTTSNTESGPECCSADACKHEKNDIGNPVIRIPEHIPERSREEETIAEAGNPDIRFPDSFKSEDGLRVRRALETGDAEDEDEQGNAENGDKTRELDGGRAPVEVQTGTGLGDTTVGQEGPKER
ncbi:hypothetical protein NDU88_002957 [Pleurodeles waltl]|uniref:Uncharacterized protein n=1 Tax=Pleurodeles waltl TaxID=8319 RepID=A0AAV7RF98_PLEWA|nr:hypothetical protein NDU88_002957 [Pleurodeles waltl]